MPKRIMATIFLLAAVKLLIAQQLYTKLLMIAILLFAVLATLAQYIGEYIRGEGSELFIAIPVTPFI